MPELDRRNMVKAVGGTALAVALAGCSALLDDADDGPGEDADVPDEPIEAGMQSFLEGPAAVLGVQGQRGAQVAVQRVNDAGGIAGREMELDVVDEGGQHVENYTQFVEQGKDVTFGPVSSGGHEAMVPVIEDEGVINVASDGTVSSLYEVDNPDPTYSFRFQNYDTLECVAAARETVERMGADNINTIAGINQNYAFGRDEQELFEQALFQLADLDEDDVVYRGWPDLGAEDMSTHISEVNELEPDVVFSSAWGGDASLLLNQAEANNMFDNIEAMTGTILYAVFNDFDREVVEQGTIYSGSRNYYWDHPPMDRWSPGQQLANSVEDEYGFIPSFGFMSGYGAVTAWATAAEKAVDLLGYWPSQEELSTVLQNHGFFTPAGYHVMREHDNQGMSPAHFGEMGWDDDRDIAVLEDLNVYSPPDVSPPPGTESVEWINSW